MPITVTRYTARNAGFLRGVAGLDPDTISAHADDLRVLALLNQDENPASATAAALLRGTEQLVLRLSQATGAAAPDGIQTISPELLRS